MKGVGAREKAGVVSSVCITQITTHTPACRVSTPLTTHPSHLTSLAQRYPGSISPCKTRPGDTRKRPLQLPEHTDRPAHTANTQQCTRVSPLSSPHVSHVRPPPTAPPPHPRCGDHRTDAGTRACAQRSAIALRAHTADTPGQPCPTSASQTDRQAREEQQL